MLNPLEHRDFTVSYIGSLIGEATCGGDSATWAYRSDDYNVSVTAAGGVIVVINGDDNDPLFAIIGYCKFHGIPCVIDHYWHGLDAYQQQHPEIFEEVMK